nr:hypothetical protein LVJ77_05535 [Conchiformibius kuhniae]
MSYKIRQTPPPSRADRPTEKWFRRGLWLIAVIFASFLIGLGGKIVGDLPQAEPEKSLRHYMPAAELAPLEKQKTDLEQKQPALTRELEQAELALAEQQKNVLAEQKSLNNWLATRTVTEQSAQNPEVLARTRRLDALREQEKNLQKNIDRVQKQQLDLEQAIAVINEKIETLEQRAQPLKDAADRRIELTVFLYRLALTLPLLLAAGWLFAKQRQSRWWYRLCGDLSALRCLRFLWNWCRICPATAAMYVMRWALC